MADTAEGGAKLELTQEWDLLEICESVPTEKGWDAHDLEAGAEGT